MHTSILTLLTTTALGTSALVSTHFSPCAPLSYEELLASKPTSTPSLLGPNGLYYIDAGSGACTYVDVTSFDFASQHPDVLSIYNTMLESTAQEAAELGVTPFANDAANVLEREVGTAAGKPQCGQLCGYTGGSKNCGSCNCVSDGLQCGTNGNCILIERCK